MPVLGAVAPLLPTFDENLHTFPEKSKIRSDDFRSDLRGVLDTPVRESPGGNYMASGDATPCRMTRVTLHSHGRSDLHGGISPDRSDFTRGCVRRKLVSSMAGLRGSVMARIRLRGAYLL